MSTIVLAHGGFWEGDAKTAEALLRYGDDPVVAVIDHDAPGHDAGDVVPGRGDGIPVVDSVEDALAFHPDRLVIGIAPVGGRLPDAWRAEIRTALETGVDVAAGLHDCLGDDPDLVQAASTGDAAIHDVRRTPEEKPIFSGQVLDVDAHIVLTVGTDCSSGKMTTSVELVQALKERGLDAAFAATGQTGILIGSETGVVIDAVPSDFVAGWAEKLVLDAIEGQDPDVVVVEGQGALSHPAYAAVSLGLLHGSAPDQCVLCHDAARKQKGAKFANGRRFPVLPPEQEWGLIKQLGAVVREPELAGLSIMNGPLSPRPEPFTEVPIVDVLADGADGLAEQVAQQA